MEELYKFNCDKVNIVKEEFYSKPCDCIQVLDPISLRMHYLSLTLNSYFYYFVRHYMYVLVN